MSWTVWADPFFTVIWPDEYQPVDAASATRTTQNPLESGFTTETVTVEYADGHRETITGTALRPDFCYTPPTSTPVVSTLPVTGGGSTSGLIGGLAGLFVLVGGVAVQIARRP